MPRFEYRLSNAAEDYPVLYFYEAMDEVEAAMRFACDYFVKEGKTWLKTAYSISQMMPMNASTSSTRSGD